MLKGFVTFLCISFSIISCAQVHEVGLSVGGTNYIGDIGSTNYFYADNIGTGLLYKYNLNPRIALRGSYRYVLVSAEDANASTSFRKNRGLKFSNTIHELALGMEFNFYDYDHSSPEKDATPYILLELSGFGYQTLAETATIDRLDDTQNTYSYTIPFGVGYKMKLLNKFAVAFETKFSYTFKDDLDFQKATIPELNFGGNGNDWYVFSGISIVYTFGRPACYSSKFN